MEENTELKTTEESATEVTEESPKDKEVDDSIVEKDEQKEESTNNNGGIKPTDYKLIKDYLKMAQEQYDTLRRFYEYTIKICYGFEKEILFNILQFRQSDIETMSYEDMKAFASLYTKDKIVYTPDKITTTSVLDDEKELRDALLDTKNLSVSLYKSKQETEELTEEANDVFRDYYNYLNSDKIIELKKKRIATLEEAVQKETDNIKKREIEEMLDTMKKSLDFSFVKDRFLRYGDDEIKNIIEGFNGNVKGSYIVNKYKNKIHRFGFNPSIYTYFFNIEENFLPEEYGPFNNLFLFIYMRMVAYSDPYNKRDSMFIKSLTGGLANLVYHKFTSDELEQEFISVIEEIDHYFINYSDLFKENNSTFKNHEKRKEMEENKESNRKMLLEKKYKDLGLQDLYDASLSSEELTTRYNEKVKELIQTDIRDEEEANKKEESSQEEQIEPTDEDPNEIKEEVSKDDAIKELGDSLKAQNESMKNLQSTVAEEHRDKLTSTPVQQSDENSESTPNDEKDDA